MAVAGTGYVNSVHTMNKWIKNVNTHEKEVLF